MRGLLGLELNPKDLTSRAAGFFHDWVKFYCRMSLNRDKKTLSISDETTAHDAGTQRRLGCCIGWLRCSAARKHSLVCKRRFRIRQKRQAATRASEVGVMRRRHVSCISTHSTWAQSPMRAISSKALDGGVSTAGASMLFVAVSGCRKPDWLDWPGRLATCTSALGSHWPRALAAPPHCLVRHISTLPRLLPQPSC